MDGKYILTGDVEANNHEPVTLGLSDEYKMSFVGRCFSTSPFEQVAGTLVNNIKELLMT